MSEARRSPAAEHELHDRLIEGLQTLHAIKSGALRMFDPMLAAVRRERDDGELPEVVDLLERMLNAFGGHRQATAAHARRLRDRLEELGARPSRARDLGMALGGFVRAHAGSIGGQNHGRNARDAFVFEHLEIAAWELLEQLAERAGDARTAELARECRAEDDEMAALIRRNFTNVLSLMLASEGLPTLRADGAPEQREEGGDAPPPAA